MTARLMTPLCFASLVLAALQAEGAIPDRFPAVEKSQSSPPAASVARMQQAPAHEVLLGLEPN